jgi:N-6 DNA Methylase
MARDRTRRITALPFDAVMVEGALIAPAMLARIAQHQAGAQAEADYGVPKGLSLRDEIARYFRIGQALFADFNASKNPSRAATVNFVEKLLHDVFGFVDVRRAGIRTQDEREFAVTLEALDGRVPVVVVPATDDLDHPSAHLPTDGRRRSAASAVQDWLNAGEGALWGLCANGSCVRLVRGNASLTRPAYIEADLRHIFEGDAFADFAALWLLFHSSRFGQAGAPTLDCALERWREAGLREGLAARDRLRDGVESALLSLGNGLLSHSDNGALRERLRTGLLSLPEFFGQLLRLVYRLIFLLAAEDRNLLHAPDAPAAARKLYAEGYSVGALRDRAVRRAAWDRHHDRWEGLLIALTALARGEPRLGLPALDGLFAHGTTPDLDTAKLANRGLMEAIYRLAWLKEDSGLVPVNWRDMETEELGSVYESLLELTPHLTDDGRGLAFAEGSEAKGHARKTSGSYYTPDSLVQTLLESALDPVLDRVEAEADDPAVALLAITVVDPACGSGHFLLAAARRIATRLARARGGGVAAPAEYRHALRDVARACIHGVDRNPMAVELTKVALWIETVEPGKPLGFLDANIRCGDSLFGLFDLKALQDGIPDAAYKPLSGDDKETAKHFEKRNKAEREGQGSLDFSIGGGRLPTAVPMAGEARALRAMPEDSPDQIAAKRRRFEVVRTDPRRWNLRIAADLYIAAFLTPKTGGVPANRNMVAIPTTAHVWDALAGGATYGPLVGRAQDLASAARAFHWAIEFPDVTASGGFDVVLGNPPWERIKLQEQEFFAAREPEIAEAPNAAARARLIAKLKVADPGTREWVLYEEFEAAKRTAEAASVFARESGRFPMTGRGDVNTYALFAELFSRIVNPHGRAGVIVPTGIATDSSTSVFFGNLVASNRLLRLYDFQTGKGFFDDIGHARFKFCLMTIGERSSHGEGGVEFAFFLREMQDFAQRERFFSLSAADIAILNPNSKTAPVFRSRADAELMRKIYANVPILIDETKAEAGNQWGIRFARMFDMSNDSTVFRTAAQLRAAGGIRRGMEWDVPAESAIADQGNWLPLYEAKMVHHFDHRWATYDEGAAGDDDARYPSSAEKCNPQFEISARYWVQGREVFARLSAIGWDRNWLCGWRDITNAGNERTVIGSVFPTVAVGNSLPIWLPSISLDPRRVAAFVANLASLPFDYSARLKVGGTHLNYFIAKQIAILPPLSYSEIDLAFIVPRVLELTYTSHSMAPFAHDLGYNGRPFDWDEDRRAQLRAELDAFYARAYGLTRDELRYILDPADVKGPDYPSETFRVLKTNEIRRFGEYRTGRLVLRAWDRMEVGEIREISPPIVVSTPIKAAIFAPADPVKLPDQAWARPGNSTGTDAATAQLAALVKALPGPTAISRVRLAALYALEPRFLTRRLGASDRATWRRLVGPTAEIVTGTKVVAFAPKIDAGWRDAITQLRGMGAIVEDATAQTWAAGPKLDQFEIDPASWPYGRATFVLKAFEAMTLDDAIAHLPALDQAWVKAHAA